MALPTTDDLIAFLRIEDAEATAEAALLNALLARAKAIAARYLRVPLAGAARTMYDDAASSYMYKSPGKLLMSEYPCATADPDAPTITDAQGDVLDPTTYRVDGDTGQIIGLNGTTFPAGPYKIVAKVGLDQHSEYADIEPVLSAAILDIASDLYNDRDPKATTTSDGGGVSETRAAGWIPDRAQRMLDEIAP